MLLAWAIMACVHGTAFAEVICDPWEIVVATTPVPPQAAQPAKQAAELLANVPQSADVLMVGDSLIQAFPTEFVGSALGGRTVWNYGVRQDRTQTLLYPSKTA